MFNSHAGDLLLWRLVGPPGPPITHATTVAGAGKGAEISLSITVRGTEILPKCLYGPSKPGEPHLHAFRIPLDRDGDGRIDHFAYHIPGGLCMEAAKLLAMRGKIRVDHFGLYDLVAEVPDAQLSGPARRWRSITPFFGPDHSERSPHGRLRAGYSAAEQLTRELGRLGRDFPSCEITALDPAKYGLPPLSDFRRVQRKGDRKEPPQRPEAGYFLLTFETPVAGPIAAGSDAHFGLGCFVSDIPVQTPWQPRR